VIGDASYLDLDPETLAGLVPEKTAALGLSVSQMLYDDRRVSEWRASKRLRDSEAGRREAVRLDVLRDAGSRFLELGLAEILVRIQLDNVRLTEDNLGLARRRFDVGYSGRDEVYRWEAQVATERSTLLARESELEAARIRLNQTLGVEQDRKWSMVEVTVDPDVFPLFGGRLDPVYSDPRLWREFPEAAVRLARENAPELASLESSIEAGGIRLGQTKRSFLVPSLTFGFRYRYFLDRDPDFPDAPDDFQSLELAARLPLLEGGRRIYDVRKTSAQLVELERSHDLAAEEVERRVRTAAQRTASSFPAVGLTRTAADAATRNLGVVQDKYAQGLVNVTDLLDAQNQANQSNQAAAGSVYRHTLDLVDLQRAIGWFELEHTPAERDSLVARIREEIVAIRSARTGAEEEAR
jgi:outer membrane protein TolC